MTRTQVANRLGVSVATVRRLENKELHPDVGLDGVRKFAAEQVEALAAKRPHRQPREPASRSTLAPSTSIGGEVAAGLFEDFELGRTAATIVVARKVSPEVVRRLHSDWLSLRELDLDAPTNTERLDELEARVRVMEDLWRQLQEQRSGAGLMRMFSGLPRGGPTVAELFEARAPLADAENGEPEAE